MDSSQFVLFLDNITTVPDTRIKFLSQHVILHMNIAQLLLYKGVPVFTEDQFDRI